MIIVEILYLCDTKTSNLGFLMRLKPLFLAVSLLIVTCGFAQTSSERTPFKNGKMAVWLNTSMGLNVINCSDQGASPLQYIGVGANLRGGVTLEWKRCHVQATTTGLVSLISNNSNQSYAFGIDSRAEFLYRTNVFRSDNWQLWAGATLQNYFDIKEYPQLMNAALGYSSFMNLHGTAMVKYNFAHIYDGAHSLLSLYGKLSLPLGGIVSRPGFAYMDNYTSNLNQANTLLQDYETYGILFPGVSTDLGLMLNLPNSNKIGFSYCWDYLTSRRTGVYRFDHAAHTFNVSLMFNIN